MELTAPGWTLELLAACNGTHTGEELFAMFKARGLLESDTTFEQFAEILRLLVSGGYTVLA